jgi:uncharacterized protein (UPF0210 family)
MRIRAITCFINPGWPVDETVIQTAGKFLGEAKEAFTAAGYEVQSVRLACPPFARILGSGRLSEIVDYAQKVEAVAATQGIDYVSIGPATPDLLRSYELIPEVICATQNVFVSGQMAMRAEGISLPAVKACARVIQACSQISPDGFSNLRFTALGNVPPLSPFFPASYAGEGPLPAFSLATEAADLAVLAFSRGVSLTDARQALLQAVNRHAQMLGRIASELIVPFAGIDFTLAPYPELKRSIGLAIERAGVPSVGLAGSLATAAMLADTLDRAAIPRVGFSGLMFPVLEDAVLAHRAAEGRLTVNELLLYSCVCGTGLDTVPLPGDASVEQLSAILLDLAALSLRLDKPLTARLMPIPGKAAGDPTNFDFSYFANARILSLGAEPLTGALAGDDIIEMKPRWER